MVGRKIVKRLSGKGLKLRILTRQDTARRGETEVFNGNILDRDIVGRFLDDAFYLFHCAAELSDAAKMAEVNVEGTRILHEISREKGLKYFCHISSAGVVGKTGLDVVDESADCNPQNEYERSKYESELIVKKGIKGCTTVILRPINVMDETDPGVLALPMKNSLYDRLRVYVKGREYAHLVHSEQVADSAVYFMDRKIDEPEIFFIGNDDDPDNTFQGIWNKYCDLFNLGERKINHTLPLWIPYWIRVVRGRKSNIGSVRYSSGKLERYGLKNFWSVEELITRTAGISGV